MIFGDYLTLLSVSKWPRKLCLFIFGVDLGDFSMRLLTRFFLMIAVALGVVQASEIPGYIGNQSFRLADDSELNNVNRRAEDAKVDVARSEQAQAQIGDQIRVLEQQSKSLTDRMNSLVAEAASLKNVKATLVAKLEELKKAPEANVEAIPALEKEIASLDAQIQEKNKQAGQAKLEVGPINVRLDQVRNDFNLAGRKAEDARQRMQMAARQRDEYRNELIAALKKINNEGARVGQNDGSTDGADLSFRLGNERGNADGSNDGLSQGTVDGQDRFYRRGAEQGERDGSARARINGQKDGTLEGTNNGNNSAGSREGQAAGIKRADGSNAASVGIEQGKKAGLERAVSTGKVDGRNKGEAETTRSLESGELKAVNLNGSFAGSFQRRSPDYPGDFNGSNYRPNISQSKELMRKAFADGYVFTYRQYTRFEFQRRIDTDYNQRYDMAYKSAYDSAVSRDYPAHYDQGRRDADARAYNRDYPVIRAEAYRIAFDQFNSSPNRGSAEFKNSYASSESSAYAQRYEAIRSANFDKTEGDVFNANIAAQTEIYRQKRSAEVQAIYNSSAVLQFVSSEMLDGGIKGVALLDGVFQPGETTNHNVVLRNFGFKEATNVSVILENGQSAKLPSIPARSIVTIKGAVQGSINASLGAAFRSALRVTSTLSTQDAVEGRHFDKISSGILKDADQKSVRVAYPLLLSSLGLESQLLKGTKNKLKISLTNNSRREYKGELKIKLETNSQNPIITKEFGVIGSLQTTATVSDAEILIDAEQDAYRDIAISARIEQNGVVIGVLPQDFITMAKAQFADKGKVPVLVVNTDTKLNDFLDALSALGGSEKVSILDLSLQSLNAGTIANGLSQKVLVVIDDSNSSSMKSLNTFLGKSKSSTFLLIDDANAGLKNIQSLGSLKDATKLLFGKRSVHFTNPHRATGVLKSSAILQSSLRGFTADLALAQSLAMTPAELIAELKAKVTPENFNTPNDTIKVYSLKALSEVLAINVAYDESGGIFSRDKKWAKMIAEDGTLFHNALKAASAGDVVVSKLPVVLSAIAMKETISSAMDRGDGIYRDMKLKIRNATNEVLSDMVDSFEKSLKKNFKDAYNKGNAYKAAHNPFFIPEPTNNF